MTVKSSTGTARNNEYKTVMHETGYSGIHQTVRQSRERDIDGVVVKCRTKRWNGRGSSPFFSGAMRGKFIPLRAKRIFLCIAIPSSRSVLLTPLHYHPDTWFKLRFLALQKV
jgi:hypothetical protein